MKKGLLLADKVAIVTGGAGIIGLAIARRFLKEGAKVVVADSNGPLLDKNVRALKKTHGAAVSGVRTDILSAPGVRNLMNRTVSSFGTIDILVNAAAIQKPIGNLLEVSAGDWIKCVNTNIVGTMLCCKAALPVMVAKRKGKIINFSGGGATFPRPNFSAYGASKAAIVRFTETIAVEFARRGIDINAVSPGMVYTRMMKEIIDAGKAALSDYEGALKVRAGGDSPELTADLCVFLASGESDGISGKLLSAVWDDRKGMPGKAKAITNSSLYTLRRIDNRTYFEKKKR
jgi:3-oxoacyl-[acyl-carrier protein] reductase